MTKERLIPQPTIVVTLYNKYKGVICMRVSKDT